MRIQTYTRRNFLDFSVRAAAAVGLSRMWLPAQESTALPAITIQGRATAANGKVTSTPLRGEVSVLMGSGGNIAVLPGTDGFLLIDSGYATSQPQIMAALAGLRAAPLTHLVNTHWHVDHTDGNEWMHASGAVILAHENTQKRLSTAQDMEAFHAHFPPAPAGARPTLTLAEERTLKLNGETLLLSHYQPAHTDSDIAVYFSKADVLHVGDTWFNGTYPFIDYSSGGSINGMTAAAERNLKLAGASTIIVPGHGAVGSKAELAEYRDMLVTVRDNVAALKKQGKTLEEVKAARPNAALDGKWGVGFMKPEVFTGLVYQGV